MSGHSRGRAASPDGGNVVRGGWPVAGPPAGGGQCRRRAEGRPSGCRAARCPPRRRSGARAVTPSYGTGQRSIRRPPAPSDTAPAATPVIALLPRPSSMLAGSRMASHASAVTVGKPPGRGKGRCRGGGAPVALRRLRPVHAGRHLLDPVESSARPAPHPGCGLGAPAWTAGGAQGSMQGGVTPGGGGVPPGVVGGY